MNRLSTTICIGLVLGGAVLMALLNLSTAASSPIHVPTYAVSLVGKYLCYAILALALDLVWGYGGILSLGHAAFFALGGYAMGMYLMREIGPRGVYGNAILPDFMVFLNYKELPWYWHGFDNPVFAIAMAMIVPALIALIFGWLAFRSRVTGVYLSIITQAMTYALQLAFFRNDMGLGGNNGLTDFKDILGFRHSDSTSFMDFIRCSADHHSIAMARGHGAGLNHMAYEVPNFDGLMRGAGRVKKSGYEIEWGVGRHGPGNNIFSYFVEPNGFVTEYTTEVERIDEATHIPGTPDYWQRVMNGNPDRWGMAVPSKLLREAMAGKLVDENNQRCEDIISRKMAS